MRADPLRCFRVKKGIPFEPRGTVQGFLDVRRSTLVFICPSERLTFPSLTAVSARRFPRPIHGL